MKTAKEYRMESKAALKGHWGMAILLFLIYGALISALGYTLIGSIIATGALMVGISFAMMQLFRRGGIELGDLFEGFRRCELKSTIGLFVKTTVFTFLWSLLFVIPGIVAYYKYSMAPYIMADHPEMTGGEAITASKNLMCGKKTKLFCLQLSFIGWLLLCVITFGIAILWVGPWMSAAEADFYESIKDEVPAKIEE